MALHPGLLESHGISNITVIKEVIQLTAASRISDIVALPQITAVGPNFGDEIVVAGQVAFVGAYRYVYLVSLGK